MSCVLVAFKKEASLFLKGAGPSLKEAGLFRKGGGSGGPAVYGCTIGSREVRVVRTGMGFREIGADLLADCGLVVSTGFCGALSPELRAGDLVVSRDVVLVDGRQLDLVLHSGRRAALERFPVARVEGSRRAMDRLTRILAGGPRVHQGRTVTSERVVKTPPEKHRLGSWFQAVSVDMEDFYRLAAARAAGAECLCVRAVLDPAGERVPGPGSGIWFPAHLAALKHNMDLACRSIEAALRALLVE